MATAFVSFRGGTVTLVLRAWACHVVHREPGSGGRAPVCRKVVRACSQPQGMFLHFENRRSGVERERERERDAHTQLGYISARTHTHTHTHIHTHTYTRLIFVSARTNKKTSAASALFDVVNTSATTALVFSICEDCRICPCLYQPC